MLQSNGTSLIKRLSRRGLLWVSLAALGLASACQPPQAASAPSPTASTAAVLAASTPTPAQATATLDLLAIQPATPPAIQPTTPLASQTATQPALPASLQFTPQAYLAHVSKPGATAGQEGQQIPLAWLPDSEIVYSPSALDFDLRAYLEHSGGALSRHTEYLASSGWTQAADILERVALENSINPRLLLALLEYQCGCVSGAAVDALQSGYALGVNDYHWKGLYGQLWWASNQLAAGFYGWQEGWLEQQVLPDGSLLLPAASANPGSAALQVYFSRLWAAHDQSARMGAQTWAAMHPDAFGESQWRQALDPQNGFLALYRQMFGDERARAALVEPLLPPNLRQPELILPFEPGRLWSFTSGPHNAWERISSRAAVDFAPASDRTGCLESQAWVTALGDGPVVRVGSGIVVQDLDDAPGMTQSIGSDGIEQTGWAILYMHIASSARVEPGTYLRTGQRIGHPSCEGGPATGTHLHLARKYNGMWVAAGGPVPLVLDGWIVQAGQQAYQGIMTRGDQVINARPYASLDSHIRRPEEQPTSQPTRGPG